MARKRTTAVKAKVTSETLEPVTHDRGDGFTGTVAYGGDPALTARYVDGIAEVTPAMKARLEGSARGCGPCG